MSTTQNDTTENFREPVTSRLTDQTLADLLAVGDRMSRDGDYLEKLIWQIKAEAYGQFKDATRKYLDDEIKVQGSGSVAAVVAAGNRITELEKLWSSAVALRNRAVHFGSSQLADTESTSGRWPALKEVFETRRPQS
jgi:hypothetical protein